MSLAFVKEIITFEEILKELENKLNNNETIKNEVKELVEFYARKLVVGLKNDNEQLALSEIIEEVLYAQISRGYYLMKNVIELDTLSSNSSQSELEALWSTPKGVILNAQGINMINIFNDKDWYKSDAFLSINRRIINEFYSIHSLFEIISEEVAVYGSYLAIINDERYEYNPISVDNTLVKIGNPNELIFLNPQVFIQFELAAENVENWLLYYRANKGIDCKIIGTLSLKTFPTDIDEKNIYVLDLAIDQSVVAHEQKQIFDSIQKNLPGVIQSELKIRLYELLNPPILLDAAMIKS